ncbi:MAG: efflux RND transporter periplasmic adaptor subunit, partial [Pyrinomonas methylaliphatogenes]|nr:efflux RND transporter periplasmic adaptor subunit [Pyrinomonas methylaliphatogenes]
LRTATLEDVLTVPNTAIVTEGERHIVFVETSPGEFVRREVQVGEERDGRVIIRSGLREGERVVTNGSLLLDAERRMEGS